MLMRRILICFLSVLLSVPCFAGTDDPVVMSVNGYDVKKSEFEYFFRKNNNSAPVTSKSVQQYADLYLNFKLKVQAAIDEGMDKSESFLSEYSMYRNMQAEEYLVDSVFLENVARASYQQSVDEIGSEGLAYVYLISVRPKDDSREAFNESAELIDEVYGMLEAGQDFKAVALKFSQDPSAMDGGELGWIGRGQVPDEFADVVFSLEKGEYSQPFMCDRTLFIVKVTNKRDLGSYADNRDDIYNWMSGQEEIQSEAKRRKANQYAERLGWTVRDDAAVAHLDSVLEEVEPDFGNISREYHDGLLLFDISNREIWEKVITGSDGLENYFNTHRKQYKFTEPCFKGMVFFCLNEDVFRKVEAAVQGLEVQEWVDTILSFNRKELQMRVMRGSSESGLFKKGQNAYVDKLVFGTGEFEPMKGFPYVNVIGKTLTEPESVQDVAGQVTEDYQSYLEDQWVKSLRKKYKYKIYKKALKQVKP
jgi:peptidyl-prolyl cis-trans isomerase SurA